MSIALGAAKLSMPHPNREKGPCNFVKHAHITETPVRFFVIHSLTAYAVRTGTLQRGSRKHLL
jgi:hypothetical protein